MLMVEESYLPMTITVPDITDEQFHELCEQYEDFRIEYTAEGELIVMPPTDPETGIRNSAITAQLWGWARLAAMGGDPDSCAVFVLPPGARRSPDASWISHERLRQRPTCPEFVVELLSPTDRRKITHTKMLEWISNGAMLGWMIDPCTRTVTIFRPDQEPEVRTGLTSLAGEGPVEGFVLDLECVWQPL